MPATRIAIRWVAHPLTITAALVLLVNDHVLKAAFPGVVTGKLSDLAGLATAPALLALALGLLAPRLPAGLLAVLAVVTTGVGFTWVKASESGAAAASASWSALSGPSVILADPTDLLALPALGLAWWAWRLARSAPPVSITAALRARLFVALPLAVLATAGTSAPPPPDAVLAVEEASGELSLHTTYGVTRGFPGVQDWTQLADERSGAAEALQNETACVPGRPDRCYRLHEGDALGVDETLDGGATWRTAWEIPPERRQWLLRRHHLDTRDGRPDLLAALDILVHTAPGGHEVIVATGVEGLAVRSPDGTWHRVAVDALGGEYGPSTFHAGPLPLAAFGRAVSTELGFAALLGTLAVLIATTVVTARSRRPSAHAWNVVSAALLGLTVPVAGLTLAMGPVWTAFFTVAVLIVHGVFTLRGRALPRRGGLLLLAAALVPAAAFAVPYIGWSLAYPASYGTATLIALAATAVAAAVPVWTAVGVFKAVRGEPEPSRGP
ncbi:hypothetical protein AB0I28_36660 [Phytomonospora sp. NPDC050363]|uniref:hypothetical protein n=1 Tax=Phytomonospora sp. NPDC050363 TaxID=3155642 RepID=UPI0033D4CB02